MSEQLALFLNPVAQRRNDFQKACGESVARLLLADGTEQAQQMLAQEQIDLLIIDLERFDRSFDLAPLGALIARRAGAPVLVICPFDSAGWLSALMAFGPLRYAIGPLGESELRDQLAHGSAPATADLPALIALRARVQQALDDADDLNKVAEQICMALCTYPGVVLSGLFYLKDSGNLELEAQYSPSGLNLARILHRSERLLQSPLRHAFPGLVAACSGEMALLDAPLKAGEPELALDLSGKGVQMVLGLPLPAREGGAPCGALCLMLAHHQVFAAQDLDCFAGLAHLAGLGVRMAELQRDNEQLSARLTHLATVDSLTGVANRQHGEQLLELEIRRARRYKQPAALIAFDIDRFKAINDQYGHPVGDAALRAVAAASLAALRSSDALVRASGAEFLIIAPHTSAIDGLKMAEKVRLAIAQTDIPGCDRLTVSLGVAQLADQESADSLMTRVEAALGRAKRAGRNCVELAMQ